MAAITATVRRVPDYRPLLAHCPSPTMRTSSLTPHSILSGQIDAATMLRTAYAPTRASKGTFIGLKHHEVEPHPHCHLGARTTATSRLKIGEAG